MGLVSHGALQLYCVEWGYGYSYSFAAGKAYYSSYGPFAAGIVVKCEIPQQCRGFLIVERLIFYGKRLVSVYRVFQAFSVKGLGLYYNTKTPQNP